MKKDIYEYLEEMQKLIYHHDWTALENAYEKLGTELAGSAEIISKISRINLSDYEKKLSKAFDKSLKIATKIKAKAIYFEYDMDNEWEGCFYICNDYNPLEEEDDDWASDYDEDVECPSCEALSDLYDTKFDTTEQAKGINLYLIARTVASLGKVVAKKQTGNFKICMAFHDQDPIMRIKE